MDTMFEMTWESGKVEHACSICVDIAIDNFQVVGMQIVDADVAVTCAWCEATDDAENA